MKNQKEKKPNNLNLQDELFEAIASLEEIVMVEIPEDCGEEEEEVS